MANPTSRRALAEPKTVRSFEIQADRNPGAFARRQLDSLADHIDHPTLARVRLLVSELVNRAALTRGRSSVRVSVTASHGWVRAVVLGGPEEEPVTLDWALFLVRRIADRWGIGGGVWFEIDPPTRGRWS